MIDEQPSASLYLHIPFCSLKCTYCAFNTYVNLEALIPAFVDALIAEIQIVANSRPDLPLHTIFFGGGTPTLLIAEQFERILATIHQNFAVSPDAEITTEANPNDLNADYLAALRAMGINRLSIGMQTSVDSELRLFARQHDFQTVVRAVEAARTAGFDNYNLDLMYGVPQQTLVSWERSLRDMLSLQPTHVSLYALGLEEGTSLLRWVQSGRLPEPDDDLAADMYELASDIMSSAGLQQYEISNWAVPGLECRHNVQYWRNWDYIGVGPGAHGFAGGVRYATILKPAEYVQRLQNVQDSYAYPRTPATDWATTVSREDEIAETIMMNLRLTRDGIKRAEFRQRFGVDLVDLHEAAIAKFTQHNLLTVDDQTVRFTSQGRLLSNMVFRELVVD